MRAGDRFPDPRFGEIQGPAWLVAAAVLRDGDRHDYEGLVAAMVDEGGIAASTARNILKTAADAGLLQRGPAGHTIQWYKVSPAGQMLCEELRGDAYPSEVRALVEPIKDLWAQVASAWTELRDAARDDDQPKAEAPRLRIVEDDKTVENAPSRRRSVPTVQHEVQHPERARCEKLTCGKVLIYKSGISRRTDKPYAMWTCPHQRHADDGHSTWWIKQTQRDAR